MKSQQRLRWLSAVAGLALAIGAGNVAAQKTQPNVCTALETDQIKAYEAAFNKSYPDIELKFTRDSTGVITAKVLAVLQTALTSSSERQRRAWRVCQRRHAQRTRRGLDPFRPVIAIAESAALGRHGRVRRRAVNTVRRRSRTCRSELWKDLTKPVYKGKIVMPNPARRARASSTSAAGSRCGAKPTRGSSWTRCTGTSASTPFRSQPCNRRVPVNSRSASRSSIARWRRRNRRAGRRDLSSEGPARISRRAALKGGKSSVGEEADGLARDASGDAVREQLPSSRCRDVEAPNSFRRPRKAAHQE